VRVHGHVGVQVHPKVAHRIDWFNVEIANRQWFIRQLMSAARWDTPHELSLVSVQLQAI